MCYFYRSVWLNVFLQAKHNENKEIMKKNKINKIKFNKIKFYLIKF